MIHPDVSTFPFSEVVEALGDGCTLTRGSVLSMAELSEHVVQRTLDGSLPYPFVALVRQSVVPVLDSWTDPTSRDGVRRPRGQEVVGLMREGHTLKVQNVETCVPTVRATVAELARRCGREVTAVFFMTPAAETGLLPHHDDTDVVVEQVQGRKEWQVWTPLGAVPDSAGTDPEPEGDVRTYTLEPGDVLYVPRGWTHRAQALQGEPSVHVSYCIHSSASQALESTDPIGSNRASLDVLDFAVRTLLNRPVLADDLTVQRGISNATPEYARVLRVSGQPLILLDAERLRRDWFSSRVSIRVPETSVPGGVDFGGAASTSELIVMTPQARLKAVVPRGGRGSLELVLGGLARQTCGRRGLDLAATEGGAVVRVRWFAARDEPLDSG